MAVIEPEDKLGVARFIQKYGKPYDPETDDYDVPPFSKSFDQASKSSKIYNMHMYWVKQDPYVVKEFIEHYTHPGDIVLDAFCGSGMTGVAALMAGRSAILFDISPACIHIARNYTTPIEPQILGQAYEELMARVDPEIRPLYRSRCHNCGNSDAQIANTILSDVYRCPRCGAEVLFTGGGRWEIMKRGGKVAKIRCDNCHHEFTKAKAAFVRIEPVEIRVDCLRCKVRGEAKAKPLDEDDWQRYIEIEGGKQFINDLGREVLQQMKQELGVQEIPPKEPPYWYPRDVKFFGQEPRRNLKRGITHPYQMFSRRNLIALSVLWEYIGATKSMDMKDNLRFVFTAALFKSSTMCGWKLRKVRGTIREDVIGPDGIRMGTLYIPSLISEENLLINFERKLDKVLSGIAVIKQANSAVLINDNSATALGLLCDNCVDYLFYDPPYGSNINYSELNIMWEAWLGEFTPVEQEIIENEYQGKPRETYEQMMTAALKEAYRVLKPGRWLSLIYSYSDPTMFRSVQRMAALAGFIEQGEVTHIGSARKTKSQLDSDKTQQRFLVINFKKPKESVEKKELEKPDIEYRAITVIHDFLTRHGGQTRDYIYDEVIKRFLPTVQIEKFNLDEILRNFFRKVGDKWYAPGTLLERRPESPKTPQLRLPLAMDTENAEEETVLRLQEFLGKHRTVPLAELREYYLREIPIEWQDVVDFDKLIEGFTVKEGKVRLPTAEEQQHKQDMAVSFRKAQIHRYLNGMLTRKLTNEELCQWVEFCYRNEMYKEASRLFSGIDDSSVDTELWRRTKRIAEACQLRAAEEGSGI
jgi:16S rRNA G966 N2-methylase RsmD/DNA-directed RNA polymerase subunit RPC12/RpoP